MKILFTTILLLFIAETVWSQDNLTTTVAPKYSNEFLSIGIGADALGLEMQS